MSSTSDRHILGLRCRSHVQLNAGAGQCPHGDRGEQTTLRAARDQSSAMAAEQVTDWIALHQRFHCSTFEPANMPHNMKNEKLEESPFLIGK